MWKTRSDNNTMVGKRGFTSLELRQDIEILSDEIQQTKLLVSAIVKTLKTLYPGRYKHLQAIEVLQCAKRNTRIRTHRDRKETGRWYIVVRPKPVITKHVKPKKGLKPPDILKCRHCGKYIEKDAEWVINNVTVGEYNCSNCGAKNTWRADKQEKESRECTLGDNT